ncbi:MAG TPA: cupin domain-containing protein [Candidatus Acidoferrales bacterium]|jgi:oxalate decarboxylase|nr:cupin domain-containing protein [Candidatus Acidoferrales bacterium]
MSEHTDSAVSRRKFLGVSTAALTTATAVAATPQTMDDTQNAEHDQSGTNPIGPDNPPLHEENPDSVVPPPTDHANVKPFKYPFTLSHKRTQGGGWARQVTQEDLPVSTTIAGVNMRLTAGGIRELHWHKAGEWSIMLYGSARITCLDQDGRPFVDDVKTGDLWFFPTGYPHSIQGLGPDGCEFLLVFDDGAFSEYDTVLLADWTAHTPRDVLAKNFGVSQQSLMKIPKGELYIFQAAVPQTTLEEDKQAAAGKTGLSSTNFSFRLMDMKPTHSNKNGDVRIVDSRVFQASNSVAAAHVVVHPGGIREMHWHQNADEWQYYIIGNARMTVFAASGRARTMDFHKGDVGYVQQTFPHYIENTGNEDLVFLEMFRSKYYQDVSLNHWLTHLPPELVQAHLNISTATLDAIPRTEEVIVG